mgnify:CR=1 FL=1
MKKLILILITFLSASLAESQTIIDSDSTNIYLFELINEYRVENGLNALVKDSGLVNACHHHSKHLMHMDSVALKTRQHTEFTKDSIPDQPVLNRPIARVNYYSNKAGKSTSENVLVRKYDLNFKAAESHLDQNPEYRDSYVKFKESLKLGKPNYQALAKSIIYSWKISPSHNAALLEETGYKAGLYVYFYKTDQGTYMSSSTYLVTDDAYEKAVQRMLELSK